MSMYNASLNQAGPRAPAPNMRGDGRMPRTDVVESGDDLDKKNRSSRAACGVVTILMLLASVAFIIVGLASPTWVYYGPATVTTTNRGIFTYCMTLNSTSTCPPLDLGQSLNSTDMSYWNIIAIRRTVIAFFIIAVIFTGVTLIVEFACYMPECRGNYKHGFWKGSIASGCLCGLACAFQIIGMILFQVGIYYEAVYAGTTCIDCYGVWPQTVQSQAYTIYGVAYALGWSAAFLLVFVSYSFLSREVCVIRGCRPPPPDETDEDLDDNNNVDAISAVSSSAPYLKGTVRSVPYAQPYGTPRLQRYDINDPYIQPQQQPRQQLYSDITDLRY